jgi:subtilisin family serine protease
VAHIQGATPNDPLFLQQWSLQKINASAGWRIEDGSSSTVTVGVVDTGVDSFHPDLKDSLLPGFDFVDGDNDPTDDNGHGTHVAGVIAARLNNGKGIAGLSAGAKVIPLKACTWQGACGEFEVAQAIVYGALQGARVINLSLGGPTVTCPEEYSLAQKFAAERDVVLIAAAGNYGSPENKNPMMYPAGCDGYLGVGATTRNDKWAFFSEHNSSVDISAPGVKVLSTLPAASGGLAEDPRTPGYGFSDGTSMAAPHVSGLAALLLALHPDWVPQQVEEQIMKTSVDLGKKGRDDYYGAGRIDVARALKAS